jgi:murein DD-endopeptidase MepM/ murein hydrolase activator NlpD
LKQPDYVTKYPISALRFAITVAVLSTVLLAHGLSANTTGIRPVSQELVAQHDDIRHQVAASDSAQDTFVRIETLAARETLESRLRRLGALEPALRQTLRADALGRQLQTLRAGTHLQLVTNRAGKLVRLVADSNGEQGNTQGRRPESVCAQRILVERNERGGFTASKEFLEHDVYWRHRAGTIENGFFTAMARADIPSHITAATMRLFKDRIDFRHGFRKGDVFRIVYQSALVDGVPTQTGQILAVELQAKGKWHQAIWHQDAAHRFSNATPESGTTASLATGRYYSFNGTPLTGASSWVHPIGVTRVTSPFGVRTHPLSHARHHHTGVDLAAKEGTPVLASASGTVDFMGWKRGYGKLVVVRHDARYSTYYAHLQSFPPALRRGQRVDAGQRIGAVGQSGDVTGPHLHFEVREHGTPVDPMFALRRGIEPLNGPKLASFRKSSEVLLGHIERLRALQEG